MAIEMQELYTKSPGVEKADPVPQAQASQAGTETRDAVASTVGTSAEQGFNGFTASKQDVSRDAMADVQAARITSQDSPIMQRAREQGMLEAGRRGLQNSSIAVGAAQGAMADRAIPLAQQNAQQVFQQDMANQAFENRAGEINANLLQERETLNAQLETAVSQNNAEAANRAQAQLADLESRANMFNAELAQQTELTNVAAENQMRQSVMTQNADLNKQYLAGTQAMDLATIQGQYNQLISTNETAARMYDSYFTGIQSAMANKDITPQRLANMVGVQQEMLESGLRLMDSMNSLDLGDAISTPEVISVGDKKTGYITTTTPSTNTTTNTTNTSTSTGGTWLDRYFNR